MAGLDHAPPPFFKRGPAPLALLTFYALISLAVFVIDLRVRSLDLLRQTVALVVDPVQRVAQTPGSLVGHAPWTAPPIAPAMAPMAVSYTHLDVYKRQEYAPTTAQNRP